MGGCIARPRGARHKIRDFLLKLQPGDKFTNDQLQEMTGIIESVRRLRELREKEGFHILSNRDLPDVLRPEEYMLGDPVQLPVDLNWVNKRESAIHLAAHAYCDVCRRMAGDRSGRDPSLLAFLTVHRGKGTSLVVLCDSCEQQVNPKSVSPWVPSTRMERIAVAPRPFKKALFEFISIRRATGGGELG